LFPPLNVCEDPRDNKARGLWRERNPDRLAWSCRLIETVVPGDARRAELQAMLDSRSRAFGGQKVIARDFSEVEDRCRRAMGEARTGSSSVRT